MLLTRILSACVLAPLAVVAVYFGGWPFALFWLAAALAVSFEWITLVAKAPQPQKTLWIGGGVVYAALLLLPALVLRSDVQLGMQAILFLFAVVWTTDVFGYFGGRAIGGPKLAVTISPSKTWSGAVSGIAGTAVVIALGAPLLTSRPVPLVAVAVLLSAVSQVGDLGESALKRKFGVKDASRLIPGHGGVMDRIDGFWAAALCGTLVGILRGGFAAPAQGLLIW
ncbi:MAG TPA: phosphatidate cytidylyltransferase [Bauldia sp.]|nr:phosphatidate cytidylyltransferase [Bauldia sp.]